MISKWRKWSLLLLLCWLLIGMREVTATSATLVEVIARDARLDELSEAIRHAELEGMLSGPGPYTILAPIDGTHGNVTNTRQLVLSHTVQDNVDYGALRAETSLRSVFGSTLTIENQKGVLINGRARLVAIDIPASNGVIHIISTAVSPSSGNGSSNSGNNSAGKGTAAEAEEAAPPSYSHLAAPEAGPVSLPDRNLNPAFLSGGRIGYRNGIYSPSTSCMGLTWTLLKQEAGVSHVGSDRKSNPYRGDTDCGTSHPILCFRRDLLHPPSSLYSDGWSYGRLRITLPVSGYVLKSRETADTICQHAYDDRWRMAEYHDASLGRSIGPVSGHDFWARGGNLPVGTRFWVAINDQPANPWNSIMEPVGVRDGSGQTIMRPGDDPAFLGSGVTHMSRERALGYGRAFCKGMTFVIYRQVQGKVQLGADRTTNPFFGDRSCLRAYPLLCIRVDGGFPPPNIAGFNFGIGWSGGQVKATNPVRGSKINTRTDANELCQESFGGTWRMANFHDGSLGIAGTSGWAFWAYGNLPPGQRYWVSNNDQRANPWNR